MEALIIVTYQGKLTRSSPIGRKGILPEYQPNLLPYKFSVLYVELCITLSLLSAERQYILRSSLLPASIHNFCMFHYCAIQ